MCKQISSGLFKMLSHSHLGYMILDAAEDWLVSWFLWHISLSKLFKVKSYLYIKIKYMLLVN